jgi:plasmid stabilization system protein ParE
MPRAVRRHPDFEADYLALLGDLVAHGQSEWITALGSGLEDVVRMLSAFPAAGPPIAERGTVQLRKLLFRKGPYVVWYLYDPTHPDGEVWLVRLFHARQRRPAPRLGRWVPRSRSVR